MSDKQGIRAHQRAIGIDRGHDPRIGAGLPQIAQDCGDHIGHVHALHAGPDRAMLDPRGFEQIVQETLQTPRFLACDQHFAGK